MGEIQRERETESERERERVCVCGRDTERENERERERESERQRESLCVRVCVCVKIKGRDGGADPNLTCPPEPKNVTIHTCFPSRISSRFFSSASFWATFISASRSLSYPTQTQKTTCTQAVTSTENYM